MSIDFETHIDNVKINGQNYGRCYFMNDREGFGIYEIVLKDDDEEIFNIFLEEEDVRNLMKAVDNVFVDDNAEAISAKIYGCEKSPFKDQIIMRVTNRLIEFMPDGEESEKANISFDKGRDKHHLLLMLERILKANQK